GPSMTKAAVGVSSRIVRSPHLSENSVISIVPIPWTRILAISPEVPWGTTSSPSISRALGTLGTSFDRVSVIPRFARRSTYADGGLIVDRVNGAIDALGLVFRPRHLGNLIRRMEKANVSD